MVLTPASWASFFDSILSPMAAIALMPGPMNAISSLSNAAANVAFSERNP